MAQISLSAHNVDAARRLWAFVADLILILLVIINSMRLFHHAMWRDELQAFMIATASSTPLDLFANLKNERHPGLWYLLLWLISRFTSDPVAMQAAHLLIALGIWVLIWRVSPFRPVEKILLLLSYSLFWQYFVISRNYTLGVLLGFGFVALMVYRPRQRLWPWVLAGLLANTSVLGTIWSFTLAALFAIRNRTEWRAMLPGAAIYAGLTALAIGTMIPDATLAGAKIPTSTTTDFSFVTWPVVSAFFPLYTPFVQDSLILIGDMGPKLSNMLVNPSPALSALVLILPIFVLCTVKDRLLVATYAATVIGILLFVVTWHNGLSARQHGFLFVALISTVWMWRAGPGMPPSANPRRAWASNGSLISWAWIALLAVSALGGLTTLSSELDRPYSQSRNTAIWLENHHLLDEFLIGSPGPNVSPVSGYLRRPLYYLDCECFGSYVKWTKATAVNLDLKDVLARVARALDAEHSDTAIVIVSYPFDLDKQQLTSELVFEPLERFPNAIQVDESYVVYRAKKVRIEHRS